VLRLKLEAESVAAEYLRLEEEETARQEIMRLEEGALENEIIRLESERYKPLINALNCCVLLTP
jgi:hypothetical protein